MKGIVKNFDGIDEALKAGFGIMMYNLSLRDELRDVMIKKDGEKIEVGSCNLIHTLNEVSSAYQRGEMNYSNRKRQGPSCSPDNVDKWISRKRMITGHCLDGNVLLVASLLDSNRTAASGKGATFLEAYDNLDIALITPRTI